MARNRTGRVVRVADGDTIVVSQAGKSMRVRLIGVDCPALGGRGKPVEHFARESISFVRSLLDGREVLLVFDPEGNKQERKSSRMMTLTPDNISMGVRTQSEHLYADGR
jgi:endonuclease YncB( thermonuclease family)